MLRSTLKRNLFPIVLITLGCLIFLAIILYVFRAHLATVVWVLLGLLLIGVGVIGIVASNPKHKARVSGAPSRSSSAALGTAPSMPPPKYSTAGTRESKPGRQDTITVSRPLLIAAGVLFVCLVLLLLGNVGISLRSLMTVRNTQIIDCREAARYAEDGWQFVSAYSYRSGDEVAGYTDHTDCVMERERFFWTKDRRAPKKETESTDDASIDDASIDDASFDDASTEDDTGIPDSVSYVEPTQTYLPQPSPTQRSLPTATVAPVSSPLPTWTPPPSSTPQPTLTTPPPSPTLSPIPSNGVDVCEATSNAAYLDTYVQWQGVILETPTLEDDGLWFQVQWTNPDSSGTCAQAIFFVSYDATDSLFEEDMVLVSGTITEVDYEYETELGQIDYAVIIQADKVELLEEP